VKKFAAPRRLVESTSGRIIELLRRGTMTIDEIAGAMELTRTAVRAQLARLQHEGTVEIRGLRRGPSKPARLFGVTAQAELQLSSAYVPILTQLLHVLAHRLPRAEFATIMREVGRGLMVGHALPSGTLEQRVHAASDLLNELGGTTDVEKTDGHFLVRGHGCPLAAATAQYPEACSAMESLLREFIGGPVAQCCDRYEPRRCCFEIGNANTRARRSRTSPYAATRN
jgi:predicted ArsR family transcriptional regulator